MPLRDAWQSRRLWVLCFSGCKQTRQHVGEPESLQRRACHARGRGGRRFRDLGGECNAVDRQGRAAGGFDDRESALCGGKDFLSTRRGEAFGRGWGGGSRDEEGHAGKVGMRFLSGIKRYLKYTPWRPVKGQEKGNEAQLLGALHLWPWPVDVKHSRIRAQAHIWVGCRALDEEH